MNAIYSDLQPILLSLMYIINFDVFSSAAEASEPENKGIMPSKQAEAYNGSMFDNYDWSQSHTDVDVHVHLPKNTPVTKKDIGVEITRTRLKVYLKNGLTNDGKF